MKRAIVHLELRSSTVGRSCETLLGEVDQQRYAANSSRTYGTDAAIRPHSER